MATTVAVTGMLAAGPGMLDLDRAEQGRVKPSVDPWYDVLAAVVDEGDVLVLARTAEAVSVRRRLARVRTLLATERLALVPLPLAPLAAGVLAQAVAGALAGGMLAPAQVPLAVRDAVARCLDLGVVRRVSDLDLPSLTVRHQLRSYLPWSSRFVVQVAPTMAVGHLAGKDQQVRGDPIRLPQFECLRALTAGSALPPAVQGVLDAASVTAQVVSQPALASLLERAWRDASASELVVAPARDEEWLAAVQPSAVLTACGWCGRARVGESCLFCRESLAPASRTGPTDCAT